MIKLKFKTRGKIITRYEVFSTVTGGRTDGQTDRQTDICDSRIAFAAENIWNGMCVPGNYGLSLDQSMAQMGMWCMLASPLIMSADLRTIRPEFKEILLNRNLIKLNQVHC